MGHLLHSVTSSDMELKAGGPFILDKMSAKVILLHLGLWFYIDNDEYSSCKCSYNGLFLNK